MLDIGSKIAELRKAKKWSQEDLAKEVGSSRVMIGGYERNSNTPSIDIILKIADALDVSNDFLVGKTTLELDNNVLKRVEEVSKLDNEEKEKIFMVIDALIRDFKAKKTYSI